MGVIKNTFLSSIVCLELHYTGVERIVMNTNNFWGMSRSTGMNVGLIVRVGLVTLSLVGSLMLAWTLLNPHQGAHASPNTPSPTTTTTSTPSPTITATSTPSPTPTGTPPPNLPPGIRGTIIPKNLNKRAAAWVHSDHPVVVERPTYFSNFSYGNAQNVSGSATVVGAPAPSNDWRFAEGYIGGQFQENLVLANFGTTTANAMVVLEYGNGSTLTQYLSY